MLSLKSTWGFQLWAAAPERSRIGSKLKTHFPRLATFRTSSIAPDNHAPAAIVPHLLDEVKRSVRDVFFVEIGAMDGVSFDPLHPYVTKHHWRGLLVEPLSDLFAQLKHTYAGQGELLFEHVAIADRPGTRQMYRVSLEAIEKGLVPDWAKGIASFFTDRNALGGQRIPPEAFEQIRPYIVSQSVTCERLDTLLCKHKVKKIDVFMVDVEGYDYEVLCQLDLERFKPRVILMEWYNLPDDEQAKSLALLTLHGYEATTFWEHGDCNLVAWR
jgi:FkbM family methyltransferase